MLNKLYEILTDFEWMIKSKIFQFSNMIERMIFWGWNMRYSWDFDANTCYEMLYLKLNRVHNCMKNHNHCLWNSNENTKDMKRLCELKGLAKKLSEDNYFTNTSKFHDNYFNEEDTSDWNKLTREWHPNAKGISNKLFSEMFQFALRRDRINRETDKKRFYMMLEKYMERFWD